MSTAQATASSSKKLLVTLLVLVGVGIAGVIGYIVFWDEATGVCIENGQCGYKTRGQCSARWVATKDFYSASATCRSEGFTNCDSQSICHP